MWLSPVHAYNKNFQKELQLDNSKSLTFQPNLGIGFSYEGISVDYAITDIGDQSVALYSNIFSIEIYRLYIELFFQKVDYYFFQFDLYL